ncbi:DUF4238 domain-containing protein [Peribacillus frigoritolerans]|uniref:DUF4238 domain-containing protein n=1 Tax=Peribacillus frigoritolerans TaxID=450367 RepID=UPI0025A3072B|nr:DUF4238 domain-containing protein [Peribacillus frigoritolerans]MDM5313849.1 DUF4238 domain-containing protein [Peribacillus frigoritolerans]
MSNPKKQHYVPQVYLNFFAEESGFLNIYDREKDEFRKQTPAKAGNSTHFYTVEVNGEKDYSIEKMLANHVEGIYKPVIRKIENKEYLTRKDKESLAVFIAFQHLRTPAQRKNYNHMVDSVYKKFSKIAFQMQKVHGQLEGLDDVEIESLGEIFENEKYDVKVPKEHSLEFMLSFSEKLSHMLLNHNFAIIKASSKSEFITSDNPYCMVKEKWSPPWSGHGVVNTTKIFPLTPRYLLILKDAGDKMVYMQLGKAEVREMNFTIASWSDRFLYSKNEFLLKSLIVKIKKKLIQSK